MFRVSGKRKASEVEAERLSRSNTMASLASETSTGSGSGRAEVPPAINQPKTSETTRDPSLPAVAEPKPCQGLSHTSTHTNRLR